MSSGPDRPFKPVIPIVIGVVGRRRCRPEDAEELEKSVKRILGWFQLNFPLAPVVVMSSLAEGADQLAARVALDLGMKLKAPLPFPPEVYARSTTFEFTKEDDAAKREIPATAQQMLDLLKHPSVEWLVIPGPIDDLADDDNAGWQKLAKDPDGTKRHECYANAGAYIVRHCHGLVALCDEMENGVLSFTGELVRFKLTGIPPRDYSTKHRKDSTGEIGPVFVVTAPKPGSATHSKPGKIEVRVPRGPEAAAQVGDGLVVQDALWLRRQTRGRRLKRRIYAAMGFKHGNSTDPEPEWEQFTDTCIVIEDFSRDLDRHWNKLESEARGAMKQLFGNDGQPAFAEKHFETLVQARQAAAGLARMLDRRVGQIRIAIFGTVFTAILSFHFYSESFLVDQKLALLLLSLVCLVAAGALVVFVNRSRIEERRLDYRSLAEALRVRIWWAFAGLEESVADNYLAQLRSEMAWARRALFSLAPPPVFWRRQFEEQPISEQIRHLRVVCECWVQKQREFYINKRRTHHSTTVTLRRWGLGLALTGWLLGFALLVFLLFSPKIHAGLVGGTATAMGESNAGEFANGKHLSKQKILHAALALSGVLIVAGGFLVAYRERQAYEELANQYDRMAAVFAADLKGIDTALAMKTSNQAQIAEIQEILKHLGQEAMTEHAQWLILRRSRLFELMVS